MTQTIEVSKEGTLLIPADVLEQMKPHTRFIVEVDKDRMVLRPENKEQPFWATATPQERAEDLRQWVASHKGGPGLPAEALRRESMYD